MDEEPQSPMPANATPASAESVPMSDRMQKQRTERAIGNQRKSNEPQLRVVDQDTASIAAPATVVAEEKKRRHFEGKSIEYTIDELLLNNDVTGETLEKGWGEKQGKIPAGILTILVALIIGVSVLVYRLINKDQEMIIDQTPVIELASDEAMALQLIQSIETTVRGYLAAKSIEEKVRFVRHPSIAEKRMESFYQNKPPEARPCELVTKMRPLTLGGRPFWQVLAVVDQARGEGLLLEQISDTEVLVDWESHVDYQPVPWEKYAAAPDSQPMALRVLVEESPRYIDEFMDESRWASFRLSNPGSEALLFGYVRRDSPLHQKIGNAQAKGFKRMILSLKGSSEFKAPQSVVIQDLVSEDIYRIEAPTSLTD